MNRKARRRAQRGHGPLLAAGPRWAAVGRGLRRQIRTGARTARRRRNELLITTLYAVTGALCLALAAILLAAASTAPSLTTDAPVAAGRGLRGELIGAVVLVAVGLLLLALAAGTLRRWWQRRP